MTYNFKKELIEKVRENKVAIKFIGIAILDRTYALEVLTQLLKVIFPFDKTRPQGLHSYYFNNDGYWACGNAIPSGRGWNMEAIPLADFLEDEKPEPRMTIDLPFSPQDVKEGRAAFPETDEDFKRIEEEVKNNKNEMPERLKDPYEFLGKRKFKPDDVKEEGAEHQKAKKALGEYGSPAPAVALKEVDEKELQKNLSDLRNELYHSLPTGEIRSFDLIMLINTHIRQLDKLISEQPLSPTSKIVIDQKSEKYQSVKISDRPPTRNAEYFVIVDDDYKEVSIFVDGRFWRNDKLLNVTKWIDESSTSNDGEYVSQLESCLSEYVLAQSRMLDKWSEGDKEVKTQLWKNLHGLEAEARKLLKGKSRVTSNDEGEAKDGEGTVVFLQSIISLINNNKYLTDGASGINHVYNEIREYLIINTDRK